MKIQMDTEAGNQAIVDGSLPKILEETLTTLKAEAAYFTSTDGMRTGYVVFDMQDSSQIPVIAEPLFQGLKAKLEFSPVMNQDDLRKGLEQASR
jgi:hypothetical protein